VTTRRRRGLLLLSVAMASGGLAAAELHDREREVAEQVGSPVEVLVAKRDIPAGSRVSRRVLALRHVPARFVPPDALASPAGVVGARTAGAVVAGGYVTAGVLERPTDGQRGSPGARRGERAVTVAVTGGGALAGLAPGTQVDVLVSTEPGAGGGRTLMALAGVELLRVAEVPGVAYEDPEAAADGTSGPTALATLRVTPREAVYLTAADNFAREIRLLSRPPGDRSPAGEAVSQDQL
jgi:pilus assembly protein CpaB